MPQKHGLQVWQESSKLRELKKYGGLGLVFCLSRELILLAGDIVFKGSPAGLMHDEGYELLQWWL